MLQTLSLKLKNALTSLISPFRAGHNYLYAPNFSDAQLYLRDQSGTQKNGCAKLKSICTSNRE